MQKPWYTFRFISTPEQTTRTTTVTKKLEPLLLEESCPSRNVVDVGNYVFLIFIMFGFGALLPWNMFINISHDYYTMYKLRDAAMNTTWQSTNFQNWMTVSAQIPNLVFSIASIFCSARGDLTRRMRVCLAIVLMIILITIGCIYADTTTWISSFFILTIGTIIVLNAANGLFQNSLFGLASSFPFKYTNAIIIGQNFCGIAVTIICMASKAVSSDIQLQAALFFGFSAFVIITCFILLNVVKKLSFYQRYDASDILVYDDSEDEKNIWEDVAQSFSSSKAQFANIFFLFFVTLALFPNVCMYIKDGTSSDSTYNFVIPENYFMDVTTFLNFNLFAFLGSLTANYIQTPGPNFIWIAVLARLWFLFYFPAANYQPIDSLRHYPVLFESTWVFVLNVTALAFSSGYLCSLIMMYAPKTHPDPRIQRTIGMISAFFLIAGVVGGLIFSWQIKLFIINYS